MYIYTIRNHKNVIIIFSANLNKTPPFMKIFAGDRILSPANDFVRRRQNPIAGEIFCKSHSEFTAGDFRGHTF